MLNRECVLTPACLPRRSWINGSSTDALYNGKDFVTRSVQLGEPTLLVTLNYRLGVMGFIAGFEAVAADKAGTAVLNAGYWDQRTALKWIQDNIAAFGGNPAKVTLSGQSAGANSVAAQMLANGGQTEGLFRAAILQSGSQALSPRFKATDAAGLAAYSILLAQTMCLTLKCLRSRSAVQLIKAQSVITQITGIKAVSCSLSSTFSSMLTLVLIYTALLANYGQLLCTRFADIKAEHLSCASLTLFTWPRRASISPVRSRSLSHYPHHQRHYAGRRDSLFTFPSIRRHKLRLQRRCIHGRTSRSATAAADTRAVPGCAFSRRTVQHYAVRHQQHGSPHRAEAHQRVQAHVGLSHGRLARRWPAPAAPRHIAEGRLLQLPLRAA